MVDIPLLTPNTITELILHNAQDYRKMFLQELDDMTKIIDSANTIKCAEKSK